MDKPSWTYSISGRKLKCWDNHLPPVARILPGSDLTKKEHGSGSDLNPKYLKNCTEMRAQHYHIGSGSVEKSTGSGSSPLDSSGILDANLYN